MSDLRNYPAFPQFPVTGPQQGLPVPTAEGRVIRALLTGLDFSARLQISGAVNRGPGTDAGFTPPEHTWVDVGTLSVEQGGYFDIPAPARWARVVLDSGTLTHGVIEEDTRAQAGTDDLLNALDDFRVGTAQVLVDTAQSAREALALTGINPAYISETTADPPAAPNGTKGAKRTAEGGIVRLERVGDAWATRGEALPGRLGVERQTRTLGATADTLTARLVQAGAGGRVVLEDGTPQPFDNVPTPDAAGEDALGPTVHDAAVTLEGASLRPTRTDKRGLAFYGGAPVLSRLKMDWAAYSARTAEGVVFHGPAMSGPTVLFSESRYAPGAAFIGFSADHERYLFSSVVSSMADAFHSANGFNTLQIGLFADDAGDDPFPFVDYAHRRAGLYGHTHAVTARLGQARGVVRAGHAFATTVGAVLDRMRVAALYHVHEESEAWTVRQPHHHLTVGVIAHRTGDVPHRPASQGTRPPVIGAFVSHGERVSLYSDLLSDVSEGHGLDMVDSQDVYYDHVILRDSAGIGARIINSRVRIGRLIIEGSGDAGLYLGGTAQLEADTVILKNVARTRGDGSAVVTEANASMRVGRLVIERDDPAAGIGYALHGTGQIDDLSWQIVGGAEPGGTDAHGVIRQRQGRPRKALIPITVRQTAPGKGTRVPLAESGRIVRVTAEQEGGADGTALIGYEVYGPGFSNVRQGNPAFVAGGDGKSQANSVNDPVAAGETVHVRWLRRFELADGSGGVQPLAMNVTVWVQPD